MKIAELRPADPETGYAGQRFRMGEEEPYRVGRLLHLGIGSATVRYEGIRPKHIEVRRGREVVRSVSFRAPLRPVAVSLDTEVTPITEEE